jgi:hypothetical protein
MKTLNLIVNTYFFDMLANKQKNIEYRTIRKYWLNRLLKKDTTLYNDLVDFNAYHLAGETVKLADLKHDFKSVTFQLGYKVNAKRITFEFDKLMFDYPIKAQILAKNDKDNVFDKSYLYDILFCIHLGKEISRNF